MPVRAVTKACSPVRPVVTMVGAVMTGVPGGGGVTVTLRVPAALAVPAALRSTQVSATVPAVPAVKVMLLVPPLVTPAVPPALVMVPLVMVHR